MNVQEILEIVVGVAVLGLVIYRQLTWQLVRPSRMWRMPVILGIIGIYLLSQIKGVTSVSGTDIAILAGELVLAVGVGAAMGSLAKFRTRPQRESDVRSGRPDGQTAAWNPSNTVIETKTGGWGAALWIVMIAIRVGIEFGAREIDNSALISAVGVIYLVIAVNRIARVLVIMYRLDRQHLVPAA
jgi:hypothetical protein